MHNPQHSLYSTKGCTPSLLFNGRELIKLLDLKFENTTIRKPTPNFDFNRDLQDVVNQSYAEDKQNIITSYHKYRNYFDKKAKASPIKLHSYVVLLNPKLATQSEFASNSVQISLAMYRIEKFYTT